MSLETGLIERSDAARPLWLLTQAELPRWLASQPRAVASWIEAHAFQAERHRVLTLPDADGAIRGALAGLGPLPTVDALTVWHAAALPDRLPAGEYELATGLSPEAATRFVLGWLMGSYRFAQYRSGARPRAAALIAPPAAELAYARAAARALAFARDLIHVGRIETAQSEGACRAEQDCTPALLGLGEIADAIAADSDRRLARGRRG